MHYIKNGDICSHSSSIQNSSFMYGLNVFEGLRVYKQQNGMCSILGFKEHLSRLRASCKGIGFYFEYDDIEILKSIKKLINKDQLSGDLYIKIIAFCSTEESWVKKDLIADYIILIRTYTNENNFIKNMAISNVRRVSKEMMNPSIKSGANYINSRYALLDVNKRGYDWALFLNSYGRICESTGANIFFISGNKLITPEENEDILVGITRSMILKIASKWGYEKEERVIEANELKNFDSAFLCGTAIQVCPIKNIESLNFDYNRSKLIQDKFNYMKRNLSEYIMHISSEELTIK